MRKALYTNTEHKTAVDVYMHMCMEFAKDVSSKDKYNNFLDVVDVIIEYHNNYGKGVKENNFYDWLMILPINLSVAINGFFAGLETKRNAAVIRAYRVVLEEMLEQGVIAIDKIEPENE